MYYIFKNFFILDGEGTVPEQCFCFAEVSVFFTKIETI